ncbi:MAG: TIGR02281 family clan AA aspartic protease [Rhodospirillales bacterium]|nr:TIGR02281 family clan AA aspartic protease [Rhodospirillales bacterium]
MNEGPWKIPENPPEKPSGRAQRGPWVLILGVVGFAALTGYLFWRFPGALNDQNDQVGFARLIGVLILVSAGFMHYGLRLGVALRYAAVWIGISGVLLLGYSFRGELGFVSDRMVGEMMPARPMAVDGGSFNDGSVALRRSANGHFHLEAAVNGRTIRFMVDTGASSVVLTQDDADRAGLYPRQLDYVQRFRTANGIVKAAPVVIDDMAVGSIHLRDVRAHVNSAPMAQSLLGMSFLNMLSGYRVDGDTLILIP